MYILKNKDSIRPILLLSLLFMFCGHAFCYANLSFSGASVMVDASKSNASLVADGQFLATLYWRVRGSLSAPMIVGILSVLYLTASAVLIADMLRITHPLSLLALCGTLSLHVGVTAINASMLHMADTYFLAFLFAVLSAWLCHQHRLGYIAGIFYLAAVPGIESSMLAAAPALLLITFLLNVLDGEAVSDHLAMLIKSLMGGVVGFALYYVAAFLFCHQQSAELCSTFQFIQPPLDMYLRPIRQLFAPTTSYAALCAFLSGFLMALSVLALLIHLITIKLSGKVALIICVILLPFVLGMPVFDPEPNLAVNQSFVFSLLPVAMITVLDRLFDTLAACKAKRLRILTTAAFGITFLSSIVFSNQIYLKKNLEYQTTLSVMTRVIEMAEQTDGFDPNSSTVAIVGCIENSPIAMAHKGFEHLAVLDAAANNYTASSQEENTWYFWEIMGYPFNFVTDFERDQLAATAAVKSMPVFPNQGCCQMLGQTLVIRLSE